MATKSSTRSKRPPRRALSTYTPPPADDELTDEYLPIPRWPALSGVILSLIGLGVATYLTIQHFDQKIQLACPTHGLINCEKVTQSSYSRIAGIPVAVLGLAFFIVMLILQLPALWRSMDRRIRLARLAWAVAGVGTALWLVYAELFKIDNICLWCTSVHILSLLLFGTTVFGTVSTSPPPPD